MIGIAPCWAGTVFSGSRAASLYLAPHSHSHWWEECTVCYSPHTLTTRRRRGRGGVVVVSVVVVVLVITVVASLGSVVVCFFFFLFHSFFVFCVCMEYIVLKDLFQIWTWWSSFLVVDVANVSKQPNIIQAIVYSTP